MKKIMALLAATVLCVGCSSSPRDNQSTTKNTPAYEPPANNQGGDNYGNNDVNDNYNNDVNDNYNYNDPYEDDYNYGYEDDYNPFEGMTYGDIVRLYRDEIISGAESVTYQQIARSSNALLEEFVKLKGQVTQVFDQDVAGYSYCTVLIDMLYETDPYNYGTVALSIPKEYVSTRPLVNDVITIWGLSMGFESVEMISGEIKTVPSIAVAKIQIIESGYGYGYGY